MNLVAEITSILKRVKLLQRSPIFETTTTTRTSFLSTIDPHLRPRPGGAALHQRRPLPFRPPPRERRRPVGPARRGHRRLRAHGRTREVSGVDPAGVKRRGNLSFFSFFLRRSREVIERRELLLLFLGRSLTVVYVLYNGHARYLGWIPQVNGVLDLR